MGEICIKVTRNDPESTAPVMMLSAAAGFIYQSEKYSRENAGQSLKKYTLLKRGEVAYNHGASKLRQFGCCFELTIPEARIPYVYHTFKISDENCYTPYIAQLLNNPLIDRQLKRLVSSSVRMDGLLNISYDEYMTVDLHLPGRAEQEKIEHFLSLLNARIKKQQHLVEALKSYKRGALSKLFPQKGASVPEYRFAGFSGDWEQSKLSDLAGKTYGGGTPATSNEAFWNGTIPWIQSSDIVDGKLFSVAPRKYITDEALNKSATQLVPENSIAIITRVGVGKLAFMPFPYTTSQDFLSLSKLNTDPFFTVYACYKKLQSELNAVQGTSIKGITKDVLLAKVIMIPKFKEQEQIGNFFRSLDDLITLHQQRVVSYEKTKHGLLQKLFI